MSFFKTHDVASVCDSTIILGKQHSRNVVPYVPRNYRIVTVQPVANISGEPMLRKVTYLVFRDRT